ncbi:MAG: hypothetical protein SGI86_21170 [Deltaproteobacteria bacterium]|nr:hypothetical protein [Deltaproteobacteria bacterium]
MSSNVENSLAIAALVFLVAGPLGCANSSSSPENRSGGTSAAGSDGRAGADANGVSGGSAGSDVSNRNGGQSASGGTSGSSVVGMGGTGVAQGGSGGSTATVPTCPAASLCDDFEKTSVGAVPVGWGRRALDGATVGASRDRSFSGTQSLAIAVNGKGSSQAYAILRGAPIFPVENNHVFGRMMVYYETKPDDAVHSTNIQGEGFVPGKTYRAQYRMGGQGGKLMLNYEAGVPSDCFQHSGLAFPVGKWACFQWEFNGPKNEIRFWYEGQELESLHVDGYGQGCVTAAYQDPWIAPKFDTMLLGWQNHQNGSPQKMFIDDVAVGASLSPCPVKPMN